jgi:hypothetical protein
MASTETNPDSLSKTIFVLTAGGAIAFFAAVYIFVLR